MFVVYRSALTRICLVVLQYSFNYLLSIKENALRKDTEVGWQSGRMHRSSKP